MIRFIRYVHYIIRFISTYDMQIRYKIFCIQYDTYRISYDIDNYAHGSYQKNNSKKKKNTYNSKHIANQLSKLNLTTSTSIKKWKLILTHKATIKRFLKFYSPFLFSDHNHGNPQPYIQPHRQQLFAQRFFL